MNWEGRQTQLRRVRPQPAPSQVGGGTGALPALRPPFPRPEGGGTSPRTAQGSRARLMRQPSTGVRGMSDVAMFSSLLNISDSVPPIQARSATTSHFFHRDLGNKEGKLCASLYQSKSTPALHRPAQTLPLTWTQRRFSLLRSFSLDLAQILQGNPAILSPVHREVQLLHQPLALIWQPVPGGQRHNRHSHGNGCSVPNPGTGVFNSTPFPQPPWGQKAQRCQVTLGSHSRRKQSLDRIPGFCGLPEGNPIKDRTITVLNLQPCTAQWPTGVMLVQEAAKATTLHFRVRVGRAFRKAGDRTYSQAWLTLLGPCCPRLPASLRLQMTPG